MYMNQSKLSMPTLVVLLLLFTTLAGNSQAQDFEDYQALLESARANRGSGTPVGVQITERKRIRDVTPNRIEEYIETTSERTQRLENLVTMDPTIGRVFPGNFFWSRQVGEGRLHELSQINGRPSVRATVSGPRLEEASFEHSGTFSSFTENSSPIIRSITSTPVRINANYSVTNTLDNALLDMGFSANYLKVEIDVSLKEESSSTQSYAVLSFDQVYYSISTDASPAGGYLPDALVRESPDLLRQLIRNIPIRGEPAYVRNVDYGRRLIIVLSSTSTEEELRRALSITVDAINTGGETTFNEETRRVWDTVEGQMILIGGRYPEGVEILFSGTPNSFHQAVKAIMAPENIIFDPEQGATPISFELAYAYDDAPMQVYETTEFGGKIPVETLGLTPFRYGIVTTSDDAAVINQDCEVDSDDWTMVEIVSQSLRLSSNRTQVLFTIVWRVYEGESNRTIRPKTIIESRRTFTFPLGGSAKEFAMDSNSNINVRATLVTADSAERWYAGEVHNHQSFPNSGLLSNIRVRFDGRGREDCQLQSLRAELRFSVWMSE